MSHPLTISGAVFEVAPRHKAGDALTPEEAAALNQLYFSSLTSKLRPLVAKAQKAAGALELPPEAKEDLDAKLQEFIRTFSYVQKSSNSYDPVHREAFKIIRPQVINALKNKGMDPKTMTEQKLEEVMLSVLAKRPDILEEARRRIEALTQVAGELV